jgi:hypothetical protein
LQGLRWDADANQSGLPAEQQRLIRRAAIDIKIVTRESDEDTKFDLFQRLNTGGSQLSDQEVRNCLLIMVDPEFYRWMSGLRSVATFQEAIAVSDRAHDEQYDLELVARFLALKDAEDPRLRFIGDMKDFLDESSMEFARDTTYNRANEDATFRDVFQLLSAALGDRAFRRYDQGSDRFLGGFSVSAFEAITVGVFSSLATWKALPVQDSRELLRQRVKDLWNDSEFRNNSGSGIRASGESRRPSLVDANCSLREAQDSF